jgi:hypothetical protein
MTEQIVDDLDRWAHKRLIQWHTDVLDRFEMVDLPAQEAYAVITAILTNMAAKSMAVTIRPEVQAEEIGIMFASLVTNARRKLREKEMERKKEMEQ